MTKAAIEARRLVGKAVLFVTLCWLVILIAGVGGALRGVSYEPLNVILALVPGLVLLPAGGFAVQLHRTSDPERISRLWVRSAFLGSAGLAAMVVIAYMLHAVQ